MGKRGQFYLISAIVLAVIILGITTVNNYARKGKTSNIDEKAAELAIESAKVLDYAVYNGLDDSAINSLMIGFTRDYRTYASEKDMYFLFGKSNEIVFMGYQGMQKALSIDVGSGYQTVDTTGGDFQEVFNPSSTTVTIKIEEASYSFKLKPGKNFHYILSEEIGEDERVRTG